MKKKISKIRDKLVQNLPKIAICSLFRDNVAETHACFDSRSKWSYPQEKLIHVCVEGDSVDETFSTISEYSKKFNVVLEKFDQHNPKYPSIVNADRFAVLARAWNRSLELALKQDPDYIMWIDSDIITPPDMLQSLLNHNHIAIAPMIFIVGEKPIFYDTWGYRYKGKYFSHAFPYNDAFVDARHNNKPFPVDSAGNVLVKTDIIRNGARFSETDEVVGMCRSISELGYTIHVAPRVIVYHPSLKHVG